MTAEHAAGRAREEGAAGDWARTCERGVAVALSLSSTVRSVQSSYWGARRGA
jgi:hypothetical protein